MSENQATFWENCWKMDKAEDYAGYLKQYYQKQDPIIDFLKQHKVHSVCDAACGFGSYSLMLFSNGFEVQGFDIAPTSVAITQKLLQEYGVSSAKYKVADVLDTGYHETFDAVTARSVLDHMYVEQAKKGLAELFRIVKDGGFLVVSFDRMEEEDKGFPHEVTQDGSFLYTKGKRNGMVMHYYSQAELKNLLYSYHIVFSFENDDGERFFVIQK